MYLKRLESKMNELNARIRNEQQQADLKTKSSFELKFKFNHFQVNNENFIREIFNETEQNKHNIHRKKRANVEIYGKNCLPYL